MMNILFLTIGTFDNIDDKGLYTDLLREFKSNGHNVYIMSPREKSLGLPTECTQKGGVNHVKVRIGNLSTSNKIKKGIATLFIEYHYLKAVKKYFKHVKFDLILYSTPPITFERVISYIKQRDNAKTYLLLKDIFPQNAVDLDMISKKSFIYKYFRRKEKKLYKQSDFIGCMSQANVDYIKRENPQLKNKIIEISPNSIEPVSIKLSEIDRKNIKRKYNIPLNKTVFIYGGNLGKPQGIDFIIECIKDNKKNNDVFFLIVGSGTEFNKMEEFFKNYKPSNAKLLERLPKEDYEMLANSCDVGLIFLDSRFTIPNIPSRLLSYMQAGMPVLAATDVNTDIGKIIEQGKFGYWCESGKVDSFKKKVKKLTNKQIREVYGNNARKYLENNYTVKHSYDIIMKHFK